ncbi:major facilitator superfamily domain-containing protein [Truncatella angustata]|uniref:Major facilitator superfamily domain-containing protein n=1 Tax=Truncatella angustata TaxID=152316 RepID=A0A9P8UHD1_9PEZI|nr:major facilitator superfamily domain-containing protein [Truncatella angustata]KAH6652138.1 major facilitator superfamily domain-containing protein [Truncatella angustata]
MAQEVVDIPTTQASAQTAGVFENNGLREIQLISFQKADPENPYNWSNSRKATIVFTGILTVINSTLSSALPSNSIPFIANEFGISTTGGNPQLVLPISIYLVGYVLGPLLFGPLSEVYGRRLPILLTFAGYTAFTLGTALSPDWAALVIFRLLGGICASAPLTIVGGMFADIYDNPISRGRAIAFFMAAVTAAPCIAPALSGSFAEFVSWRWTFWCALIIAGATWIALACLPETYGPVILKFRARKIRQNSEIGPEHAHIYAPIEVEAKGWRHIVGVILARPLRMMCTELIVIAVCLYLAIAYAIFYMFFQAYPIVFKGIYGMSASTSGLMFLPVGAGTLIALPLFFLYDSYLERSRKVGKAWTRREESRRLPLACIGGPLFVVSLLWMGWTARENIHWVVPCLAGVTFGLGNLLIFMALLNYLADAYQVFAASAMAASSCTRSIFGAILPLATTPMYDTLGVGWASTLLAFVSLVMCAIPFVFIHFGDQIRSRSAFCQVLKEKEVNDHEMSESS